MTFDNNTPYEGEKRTEELRYQKKHFPAAVLEKGGLLTEREVNQKLLEEYKDELEMNGNIGG